MIFETALIASSSVVMPVSPIRAIRRCSRFMLPSLTPPLVIAALTIGGIGQFGVFVKPALFNRRGS